MYLMLFCFRCFAMRFISCLLCISRIICGIFLVISVLLCFCLFIWFLVVWGLFIFNLFVLFVRDWVTVFCC